ncbi:MAG: DUF4440 domain-containing protein [Phycisphaeraceae bacterium]|nr:MAG: DUF4440 domain-containing protein [Phycisphaeraceae bacterium]
MNKLIGVAVRCAVGVMLAGCACHQTCAVRGGGNEEAAHQARDAYVAAINSNNLETFLAMLTDDAVFMPPNEPRVVGKEAVRAWAAGYLDAYRIHYEKTALDAKVVDGLMIEQYAYEENDTPRAGGPALHDTGKGVYIFRRGPDGAWRVASDIWNSDLPTH